MDPFIDALRGIHPLRVCVGYKVDGKKTDSFPDSRRRQAAVEPIYEDFEGFTEDISGVRKFAKLPASVRRYLRAIERRTGRPIRIVSVGPGRDSTIRLRRD